MFTFPVSWLLVACIPGFLMLATLGLGRLEKSLARDTVTANDVAEFLEQAEAVDVHTLAREGMPEALDYLHRRQALGLAPTRAIDAPTGRHHVEAFFASDGPARTDLGVPTRVHRHARSNPQFAATRHINRV